MSKIKGHLSAISDLFDTVQIQIDKINPSFSDRVSELRASIEDLKEDLEEEEDCNKELICNFELGIDNCGFQHKNVYACKHLRKCDMCGN